MKTSDIRYAGTDSNIYLKIYGEYRKSDYIVLDKSLSHANKFERGNADRFSLREEFFGEIDKIK